MGSVFVVFYLFLTVLGEEVLDLLSVSKYRWFTCDLILLLNSVVLSKHRKLNRNGVSVRVLLSSRRSTVRCKDDPYRPRLTLSHLEESFLTQTIDVIQTLKGFPDFLS